SFTSWAASRLAQIPACATYLLRGIWSDPGLITVGATRLGAMVTSFAARFSCFLFSIATSLSFFHFRFSWRNCSLMAALLFFFANFSKLFVFFISMILLFYNSR